MKVKYDLVKVEEMRKLNPSTRKFAKKYTQAKGAENGQ